MSTKSKHDPVIARILSGGLPQSYSSDNLDRDEKQFRRLFRTRKIDNVGITKERERGLLWFKKKRAS